MPIVVTDQYGNEYTTSVQVEVAARNKKNADDFDWDESVIYFMVTDRFFDGNESNNTACGKNNGVTAVYHRFFTDFALVIYNFH